ncbi:PREDICTED: ZW10 interactor-like [Elephantulus edwardii]|uniref:ZW10 interactor-like n=1 Tax=Elephantulus edwardii TaxID=28737 RepID=UPI0003F098D9|nr:PREDICTED: ZW10 interactor-like [Elephantulus edwardii]
MHATGFPAFQPKANHLPRRGVSGNSKHPAEQALEIIIVWISCTSRTLAEVSAFLEPVGLQEEAGLPAQILAEFVMDSRKKDKLLFSQLQLVGFVQDFLVHEDASQGLDLLASEDVSRQKATEAKEHWKELKATYQQHVEAITSALPQALSQIEEIKRKQTQLQQALEQLQAKKQMAMEKRRAQQKQWQLQQEEHLQQVAEVKDRQRRTQQKVERQCEELRSLKNQAEEEQDKLHRYQAFLQLIHTLQNKIPDAEGKLQLPQEQALHLDLPEDKLQLLAGFPENKGDL